MTAKSERDRRSGDAAKGIGLLLLLFVVTIGGAAAIAAVTLFLVG